MIFLFSFFGGLLCLVFWRVTSTATVFLHVEGEEVSVAADHRLARLQEAQREARVERQRQIEERGFLRLMRPQRVVSVLLIALWIHLLTTYW